MFLAGLATGAAGGLLIERWLVTRPRRMPYLDVGQRVLAEKRGKVEAALLEARVQTRYHELQTHRPRFHHPALRQHLEDSFLPGLALYQTLREEIGATSGSATWPHRAIQKPGDDKGTHRPEPRLAHVRHF